MSGWGFQRTVKSQRNSADDDDDDKILKSSSASRNLDGNTSQKINAVMEELSHDIHKFGRRVHKIQQYTRDIGTTRDTDKLRSKLKAERTHAAKVNERIHKHINKLSRSLLDGGDMASPQTQISGKGGNTSNAGPDLLDSSSMSHRRQQLKKLKLQATDMEKQYNDALKESVTKEKKFARRPSMEEQEEEEEENLYEDAVNDEDSSTDGYGPNSTRSIVREQMKQQQEKQSTKKKEAQQQQQKQLDKQIKMVLSSSDKSTIDVEHMIAAETYRELKELELNYAELHECFTDLNSLINEQDPAFNVILSNIESANRNVEMGVEDIKISKSMTAVGGIQKLTKKIGTFGKFL